MKKSLITIFLLNFLFFWFFFSVYFTCIVKVLYNLLYYQLIVKLCASLTDAECDQILAKHLTDKTIEFCGFNNLGSAMAFVLNTTDRCRLLRPRTFLSDSMPSTSTSTPSQSQSQINLNLLEQHLQKLSLPFLRIAALLRHHLYEQNLPEINVPQSEFVRLVYFLELVTVDIDWDSFDAAKALHFIPGMERQLPESWCKQLINLQTAWQMMSFRNDTNGDANYDNDCVPRLIADQHGLWQQPKLLRLPREYEKLFTVSFFFLFPLHLQTIFKIKFYFSIIMSGRVQTVMKFLESVQFVCYADRLFVLSNVVVSTKIAMRQLE